MIPEDQKNIKLSKKQFTHLLTNLNNGIIRSYTKWYTFCQFLHRYKVFGPLAFYVHNNERKTEYYILILQATPEYYDI